MAENNQRTPVSLSNGLYMVTSATTAWSVCFGRYEGRVEERRGKVGTCLRF